MENDANETIDLAQADIVDGLAVHSASKNGFGKWYVTHAATLLAVPITNFHNDDHFGFSTYLAAVVFRDGMVGLRDWTKDIQEPITKDERKVIEHFGLSLCHVEEDFLEQLDVIGEPEQIPDTEKADGNAP